MQQPQQHGPPLFLAAMLATDPFNPHSIVPARLPNYDPANDVEAFRKATKGFGTNENSLHRIMCFKPADQMQVFVAAYKARYGKDVVSVIKSETSGYHERTLVALANGPLDGDADLLHEACAGMGTKELLLTEIIIGRSESSYTSTLQTRQLIICFSSRQPRKNCKCFERRISVATTGR